MILNDEENGGFEMIVKIEHELDRATLEFTKAMVEIITKSGGVQKNGSISKNGRNQTFRR